MTLPGLSTDLETNQDQLEYLATASVVVPFIAYTIFLCIVPVSLVLISFFYHRVDTKLHPDSTIEGESRKFSYSSLFLSPPPPPSIIHNQFMRRRSKIYSIPTLEWLGLPNQQEDSVSEFTNNILWPMFSYGIIALAKPIILFLFATFLISLTVYPDEGKA